MATLLANTVWEGVSTETKPTDETGGMDGQFFKEFDTGEAYIRVNGVWICINLGLSFIRATKSGRITTDANGFYRIAFTTPFINNLYTVAFSSEDRGNQPVVAFFSNILTTGFDIQTRNTRSGQPEGSVVVSWLATRDYNP